MVGVSLRLAKVGITFFLQAFILQDSLLLCVDQSLFFDFLLEAHEWTKLLGDRVGDSFELNVLLASWAAHKSKRDPESRPLVFE